MRGWEALLIVLLTVPATARASEPAALISHVEVAGSVVTLGDLMQIPGLPQALADRANATVVARFRSGEDRLEFSAERLAQRAQVLLPALAPYLAAAPRGSIEVRRLEMANGSSISPKALGSATCARAVHPVLKGSIPTESDFEPAICTPGVADLPVRYRPDLATVQASRNVAQGETFRALSPLAQLRPGQDLLVETQVGPVSVEREVKAVQPGAPGQSVFVQASDGAVFSAHLPQRQGG